MWGILENRMFAPTSVSNPLQVFMIIRISFKYTRNNFKGLFKSLTQTWTIGEPIAPHTQLNWLCTSSFSIKSLQTFWAEEAAKIGVCI
jgi:hypothetical protein